MLDFKLHTIESAPEGSKEMLKGILEQQGGILNNAAILAESPAAMQGYFGLVMPLLQAGSLSAAEQAVVQLSASREHECSYCVPFYTSFGPQVGLDEAVIEAIRLQTPIQDKRLATLHDLTVKLIRQRGRVSEADTGAFFAAGFNKAQLLDVIGGIAAKTLMNYLTQFVDFPLDNHLMPFEWKSESMTA